jgi:hypothetical protein
LIEERRHYMVVLPESFIWRVIESNMTKQEKSFCHRRPIVSSAGKCPEKTNNNIGNTSSDKIWMMTTRLACNRAIESSYWRMDNNSDVGLLMGYVLYRLPIELEFMDLDTFSH